MTLLLVTFGRSLRFIIGHGIDHGANIKPQPWVSWCVLLIELDLKEKIHEDELYFK
jgi:hypothetical protein